MATASITLRRHPPWPATGHHEPGVIGWALTTARDRLGLDLSFLSRVANGKALVQSAERGSARLVPVGAHFPAPENLCQRFAVQRVTSAPEPEQVLGEFLSVPLILSTGSVYGHFCGYSRHDNPALNRHLLQALQLLAREAADRIEAELADIDLIPRTG